MEYKVFETLNGYKIVIDDSSVAVDKLADHIDSSKDFQTTEIRKLRGIAQSVIIITGYSDKSDLCEFINNYILGLPVSRDGEG